MNSNNYPNVQTEYESISGIITPDDDLAIVPSSPYIPSVDEDEIEVSLREEEIAQLTITIRYLEETRASHLRHLNLLHSSTGRLAPEIMANIFLCMPRTTEGILALINMAKVCSSWREIILYTSALWTPFVLDVKIGRENLNAKILEFCIQNVGERNLDIDIHFNYPSFKQSIDKRAYQAYGRDIQMKAIARVLFEEQNARKIRSLGLYNPPIQWLTREARMASRYFSALERLTLEGPDWNFYNTAPPITGTLDLNSFPNLHRLDIVPKNDRGIRGFASDSFDKITVLHLHYSSVAIEVLLQCRNLVECYCTKYVTKVPMRMEQSIEGPVVFPKLKVLDWIITPEPYLLHHLHLPILEKLTLYGSYRCQLNDTLSQFIGRLPDSLVSFGFSHCKTTWSAEILHDLFNHLSNIQELSIDFCTPGFVRQLLKLLRQNDIKKFVPRLRNLTIRGLLEKMEGIESSSIVRMLENRLAENSIPRNEDFTLKLIAVGMRGMEAREKTWSEMMKRDMQKYVRTGGFRLELVSELTSESVSVTEWVEFE